MNDAYEPTLARLSLAGLLALGCEVSMSPPTMDTTTTDATTTDTGVGPTTAGIDATGSSEVDTGPAPDTGSSGDTPGSSSSAAVEESSSGAPGESDSSGGESSSGSSGGEAGSESTTETGGGLPNGSACDEDVACESGACFVLGPLGGFCSECLGDADCPAGGCTIPDPFAEPTVGAVCNEGLWGDGCQSDAACEDPLVCAVILDVPGIVANSTCGDCTGDADCGPGGLCNPSYEITTLGGAWSCVAASTVPDGEGCDFAGSGDETCASGRCGAADLLGVLEIGVCGACESDDDCGMFEFCSPPVVDFEGGLTPASCVAK